MSKEIVLEVKDDISEKILFFTHVLLLISSLWCLSLRIIVIADNKPKELCYRCYIIFFYHIYPNAYNIKIYRHIARK